MSETANNVANLEPAQRSYSLDARTQVHHMTSQGFSAEGGMPFMAEDLNEVLILDFNPTSFAQGGKDEETQLQVCALFSRNIPGFTSAQSQFGKKYVTWRMSCPASFERSMGTEKARQALRDAAIEHLEPFKGMVAVWRAWPRIERPENGELKLLMRLHLMTGEAYQAFVGK